MKMNQTFWTVSVLGLFIGLGIYNTYILNERDQNLKRTPVVARLDDKAPQSKVFVSALSMPIARPTPVFRKTESKRVAVFAQNTNSKFARNNTAGAQSGQGSQAIIKDDLELKLVEFYNAKKYKDVLKSRDFDGSLRASGGVIQSIEISLPDDFNISISNAEMKGNIFTYEVNNETYSGMIYSMENDSYMVNLTDGPYDGSRMKFTGSSQGGNDSLADEEAEVSDEVVVKRNSSPQAKPMPLDPDDERFEDELPSDFDKRIQKQTIEKAQDFDELEFEDLEREDKPGFKFSGQASSRE